MTLIHDARTHEHKSEVLSSVTFQITACGTSFPYVLCASRPFGTTFRLHQLVDPDHEGASFLWNFSSHLPDHTAPPPIRRLPSLFTDLHIIVDNTTSTICVTSLTDVLNEFHNTEIQPGAYRMCCINWNILKWQNKICLCFILRTFTQITGGSWSLWWHLKQASHTHHRPHYTEYHTSISPLRGRRMDHNQPGGSTTLQAYGGVREMTFRSSNRFWTKLEIRNGGNESAAVRLLRLWFRIPPGAWMFVCCECCVLSRRDLCDELIPRPEESYRLWCVTVCYLETTWMRRPWPTGGCCAPPPKWREWGVITCEIW